MTSIDPRPACDATRASDPRRITVMAARYWPDRHGGVETRMYHMTRGLADAGWCVHVLTENRLGAAPLEPLQPNLIVERRPVMQFGRLWRWSDLIRIRWWHQALRHCSAEPGLLWASDPCMAVAAMLAGRGRDLVFNPACCAAAMHHVYRCHRDMDTLRATRQRRVIDRMAHRRSPVVVLGSDNLRQQVRQFYGRLQDVRVVPLGADLDRLQAGETHMDRTAARAALGLADADFVVGFVGRLDPCKDLGFLFAAAAEGDGRALGQRGRMLIVGSGSDEPRLRRLAQECGLADRMVWTGALADPSVAYAAMDVMVLPSVYEAFGQVLVEAMAMGVPIVGRRRSDRTGAPVYVASDEVIAHGRTGMLVDPHDASDLSRVLRELRLHPQRCAEMAEHARRDARARSSAWLRGTLELLEELAGPVTQPVDCHGAEAVASPAPSRAA